MPYAGKIQGRKNGVLVSMENGKTMGFSLWNLEDRGTLIVKPATEVYIGMIIGINNRNLKTFEVTLETTRKLSDMAPEGTVLVSESGVLTDEDIRVLKESNADALLIGTAFMESENPMELALHWKDIYNG